MPRKKPIHHLERIAVLETKVEAMSANLTSIESKLDTAIASLAKNKGFWGGAILILSAVWAFVTQAGPALLAAFSSHPKQ